MIYKQISQLPAVAQDQIRACLDLITHLLGGNALAVYLYGSAVVGGLQRYSDLDLFVVTNRSIAYEEKTALVKALLVISGIYMKEEKFPIELTIVSKSEVNPWRYPPRCDFQYGEWLREQYLQGDVDPSPVQEMPDLALIITQILLASITLRGAPANQLLAPVPYRDYIAARQDALQHMSAELETDTRNVLLRLARIWAAVATDTIHSKPVAAAWAINQLPEELRAVMERARAICVGQSEEYWDDLTPHIQPCAKFMLNKAQMIIDQIIASGCVDRLIKII